MTARLAWLGGQEDIGSALVSASGGVSIMAWASYDVANYGSNGNVALHAGIKINLKLLRFREFKCNIW